MTAREDQPTGAWRVVVLWGAGVILGLIASGIVVQAPLDRRALALAKERPKLEETVRALEITVAKLPEFQKDVQALEAKQEIVKPMLPAALRADDVRTALQKSAAKNGVAVVSIDAIAGKAESLSKGVFALSFDVVVEGRLPDLAAFFDGLERAAPMMEPRHLVVDRDGPRHRARATIFAFVYMPPARPRPRQR
jgi:hypothetical protein